MKLIIFVVILIAVLYGCGLYKDSMLLAGIAFVLSIVSSFTFAWWAAKKMVGDNPNELVDGEDIWWIG